MPELMQWPDQLAWGTVLNKESRLRHKHFSPPMQLLVLQDLFCSFVPVQSPFWLSLTGCTYSTVHVNLVAINKILGGAFRWCPHCAGEGNADLHLQQFKQFPLVALTGKKVDKWIQAGVEVHQTQGGVQRHLESCEIGAVRAWRQLMDHVLQDVNVVGAVTDNKHQRHTADHAYGLAVPARLLCQMVGLGC